MKSVLEAPFEFSKNYEENVDINKQRRLRDIYAAGLVLNENDIENLNEQREKIKNKYNNQGLQNISEHEHQKISEINSLLIAGNPENEGIKNELVKLC